ncbi:adenosine deaminase [Stackebrandtia nassauensis]|uniref:adenosine deaminase n=1 Tax=Stackebrandtia nassauensis (strain DSM 44728 / CIP 108903 / NRRL B-16338 / NBRC 102104 / LLR-40K-21) TaxID=446470 RepID=D3Q5C0_STANL|nr:adenosine deaminase [Stackebrandtia nassauensis]ADD44169.1 Adenosine deaminase [Stackebrandtia nassauensis DSM 44728]
MLLKADLHLHQEWSPRLDRVLARRHSRVPFDWKTWRETLTTQVPPGVARLQRLSRVFPAPAEADTDDAFVERVTDALEESAAAGSCYTELRFGHDTVMRPVFMPLFRQAEEKVAAKYPGFRAEAVASLLLWQEPERLDAAIAECRRAAAEGLAGVDLLNVPYSSEADWQTGRKVVDAATDAGLGVTVHAGEFSSANIAAVACMDGVTRIGHATHAPTDPWLLELLAARGITIEVCLTANLILGAVPTLADHPLRRFLDANIPVALGTDNPIQFGTTIDHEYTLASRLGLSESDLSRLTRNAIDAAFTTPDRKTALRADVDAAPASVLTPHVAATVESGDLCSPGV